MPKIPARPRISAWAMLVITLAPPTQAHRQVLGPVTSAVPRADAPHFMIVGQEGGFVIAPRPEEAPFVMRAARHVGATVLLDAVLVDPPLDGERRHATR